MRHKQFKSWHISGLTNNDCNHVRTSLEASFILIYLHMRNYRKEGPMDHIFHMRTFPSNKQT